MMSEEPMVDVDVDVEEVKRMAEGNVVPFSFADPEKYIYNKNRIFAYGSYGNIFRGANFKASIDTLAKSYTMSEMAELLVNCVFEGRLEDIAEAVRDNSDYVAIKIFKRRLDEMDRIMKEINILMLVKHPNVISVRDICKDATTGQVSMVTEYFEHDLKANVVELDKISDLDNTNPKWFSIDQIRRYTKQLLEAIAHCHKMGIVHRDLSPKNIMIDEDNDCLKLIDFGCATNIMSPDAITEEMKKDKTFGCQVFQPPELLLEYYQYNCHPAMDIWAIACIIGWFCAPFSSHERYLFGNNIGIRIKYISDILGCPTQEEWPKAIFCAFENLGGAIHLCSASNYPLHYVNKQYHGLKKVFGKGWWPVATDELYDLLEKMLIYDPERRITAEEALKHPFFKET